MVSPGVSWLVQVILDLEGRRRQRRRVLLGAGRIQVPNYVGITPLALGIPFEHVGELECRRYVLPIDVQNPRSATDTSGQLAADIDSVETEVELFHHWESLKPRPQLVAGDTRLSGRRKCNVAGAYGE